MFNLHGKKAGLILMFCLVAQMASAQQNNPYYDYKAFHFGFSLGFNQAQFKPFFTEGMTLNDSIRRVDMIGGTGFHFGIVVEARLHDKLGLRFQPGIQFIYRDIDYTFSNIRFNTVRKTESANIELPLLLKFKSDRVNNYRLYVIGGGKYTIDMQSQDKVTEQLFTVKLNRYDIAAEIGLGVDVYLPFFKFSTELKYSHGTRNMLVNEPHLYAAPIDRLMARTIMLTFLFE